MGGLLNFASGIPINWRVFFLSMLPVTELRAAIPLGAVWGLDPLPNFLWAVCGNFVPIMPLLLLFRWMYRYMYRFQWCAALLDKLALHGRKNEAKVLRYGWVGLALLVAVPLPGTGVWTGCMVATLLKLSYWPAVAAITVGEVVAGIAVSLATSSVIAASQMRNGECIIIAVIVAIVIICLLRRRMRHLK